MSRGTAIVIGAGIVGLACARALQKNGFDVVLVDPEEPGSQASFGNAGLIAGSAVVPELRREMLRQLPAMLFGRDGPVVIRAPHLPRMLGQIGPMARSMRLAAVEAISKAMASLSLPAFDRWMTLLDDLPAARALFRRDGCLFVYLSPEERAAAAGANGMRRRRGMDLHDVDADRVHRMSPALAVRADCATLSPSSGHVVSPSRLSQMLTDALRRDGATLVQERAVDIDGTGPRVTGVKTEGGRHRADLVVLAAGARSRPLARRLGLAVPLDAHRGYHLDLPIDPGGLSVPLLVPSMGVAVTPLEDAVRVAGLVELAGLDAPASESMFARLERRAGILLGVTAVDGARRWMGLRPALPDGLPIIDRSPRFANTWMAFGHGQTGLTQAAATGLLIADMVRGRPPGIDLAPFAAGRFS